jgi:hypothetical protein
VSDTENIVRVAAVNVANTQDGIRYGWIAETITGLLLVVIAALPRCFPGDEESAVEFVRGPDWLGLRRRRFNRLIRENYIGLGREKLSDHLWRAVKNARPETIRAVFREQKRKASEQ